MLTFAPPLPAGDASTAINPGIVGSGQ